MDKLYIKADWYIWQKSQNSLEICFQEESGKIIVDITIFSYLIRSMD